MADEQINGDDSQPAPADRPAHVLYDQARSAYGQGDLEQAERLCLSALEEESDFLAALELAGVIACQRGDLEAGIERFESLVDQAPDSGGARFNLGNALLSAGRFEEARRTLAKADELAPANPDVLVVLGISERRLGRFDDAEAHLSKALEAAPDHLAALNALGATYSQQRKFDQAYEIFKRAVDLEPRSAQLRHNVGRMLLELGRYREAAEEFRMALTVETRNPDARSGLAAALNGMGDFDEAIHHFRRALKHQPDHAMALYGLIDTLERTNRIDEAAQLLERQLSERPDDANLHFLQARLAVRDGDDEAALQAIQKAESAGVPPSLEPRFYAEAGAIHDRLGKPDRAMMALSRANYASSKAWRDIAPGPNAFIERVRRVEGAHEAGKLKGLRAGPEENQPVFLVGFPRSGTTLLGRMLDAHPGLDVAEELPALLHIADRLDESEAGYPDALTTLDDDRVEALRQAYLSEFGAVEGRLVDKNPMNLVRGALIKRLFGGAPVIFLVRDPRDVCLSCFMQSFDLNAAMANFFTLESTARCYLEVMRLWDMERQALGLNVHEVRYEDLVEDPEPVLRGACEFLGIDWDAGMLDYAQQAGSAGIRTPSYRQVTQDVYQEAVGRWQRYRDHLEPVLPLLDPFVEEFGYPDSEADE